MDTQRLYHLLQQYAARNTSPADEKELFSLIDRDDSGLKAELLRLQEATGPARDFDQQRWQPVISRILTTARDPEPPATPVIKLRYWIRYWSRMAAAVTIFLVLGAAIWYGIHRQQTAIADRPFLPATKDIPPGGNHAFLTLASGETILLDSARNGDVASQGNARIVKLDSGRLTYRTANGTSHGASALVYNSITTPRGGFYRLGLPDGTQVWLNAASSLRFPTVFSGPVREVEMTGEAYFEVVPDRSKPFIVDAGGTKTTVLGTHFSINAYKDEKTLQTTLIQGSVKFGKGKLEKLLYPGQQAQYDTAARSLVVTKADSNQVIAWKNGRFEFENTGLMAILRQISRWYDVDIQVQGVIGEARFGGGLSRNLSLSQLLHYLESTGLHFTLKDRSIIVSPKTNP